VIKCAEKVGKIENIQKRKEVHRWRMKPIRNDRTLNTLQPSVAKFVKPDLSHQELENQLVLPRNDSVDSFRAFLMNRKAMPRIAKQGQQDHLNSVMSKLEVRLSNEYVEAEKVERIHQQPLASVKNKIKNKKAAFPMPDYSISSSAPDADSKAPPKSAKEPDDSLRQNHDRNSNNVSDFDGFRVKRSTDHSILVDKDVLNQCINDTMILSPVHDVRAQNALHSKLISGIKKDKTAEQHRRRFSINTNMKGSK
jgi:hypothetical protein